MRSKFSKSKELNIYNTVNQVKKIKDDFEQEINETFLKDIN